MHFLIDYSNLLKIRNILLISNNNINIDKKTENILLLLDESSLNVYLNNGSTSCKLIIEDENLKILETSQVFINSKIFLSLIENLQESNKIEFISRENNLLEIKTENFSCNLVCFKEESYIFDDYQINKNHKKISFKFNDLKLINNRFKYFCKLINNNINKNTILTNINFRKNSNENKFYVTSTDSFRIVFAEFECNSDNFDCNIPPYCLNNIINMFLNFEDKEIDFYYFEENLIVKTDNIFLKTKIFIGNYPNFFEWFKVESKISFEIKKSQLISSIDRNLFLSSSLKNTKYSLVENKLIVEYKDSEKGFTKELIDINNIKNQNIEFWINNLFLKQLIKNIPSDILVFNLTDSLKPIIILGKEEDKNFKQFILPLKNN